ncbi:hypothetical protein [Glaciecola sp. SC05]|uniref:hypothetical protein n=1 Tax=Glaciecola sp. SC05 TaxID=1987355 RepID=UPI003527076E
MEITQKKRSVNFTFTFEESHMNFAYADKKGSGDIDLNYADFPKKCSISIEQNEWLRNVGYLWMAIGTFQLGAAIYADASLSGKGFWLMIGLICVAWAHFSKTKYSVFSTDHGTVHVIQDKHHDTIINEINKRKNQQLLDWYGEINLENGIENEIKKFTWLEEQNVLTKEQADVKRAQLELMQAEGSQNSNSSLN